MKLINLLSSKRVIEILKILSKKSLTTKELRDFLNVSSSSLRQTLNKMINYGLIDEDKDFVKILPKGEYLLKICEVMSNQEKFLKIFGDFLNLYYMDDIPENLVVRFHELSDMKLIEQECEIYTPHKEFIENLMKSKEIYGYSSIFFPEYIGLFLKLAKENRKIEIVVSKDIFDFITKNYKKELEEGLKHENVSFYISKKKFKFSFIVTDIFFCISFFFRNGVFDYKRDFICYSKKCKIWGIDLFKYVKKNSYRINIKDMKKLLQNQ